MHLLSQPIPGVIAIQDPQSGRWYITMDNPGFNSPANNSNGYATQDKAEQASFRYAAQGRRIASKARTWARS